MTPSVDNEAEQMELYYIAGRYVKSYNHFRNSLKSEYTLTVSPSNSTRYVSKKNENSHKELVHKC
jgi:hypothetical protein